METMKKYFPVLFSPKFWGLLSYTVLEYLQVKEFLGGAEIEFFTQLVILATGVGIADSLARKLGRTKK